MLMLSQGNRSELKKFGAIAIKAIENIDKGEQLYVSSGTEYTFLNVTSTNKSQ